MIFPNLLTGIIELLIVVITNLLAVAYLTVVERKTMASMQRRLGPNIVGFYGLLQAFADALKLLLKEYVSPTQANLILFFLGPIITLVFSLLSLAVIPFAVGLSFSNFYLAILYLLAMSSLATYGILLAGWSANSKYAFLGSLRSTAQLISYELVLSSIILIVVMLTSSLNFTVIVECQRAVWFIFPLFPVFYIFFMAAIAETNRAPFDLAEAESELVSGFMTEHSSVIFVFFFLAEYASMLVICILISLLYLGGYNLNLTPIVYTTELIFHIFTHIFYIGLNLLTLMVSAGKFIFTIIFNPSIYLFSHQSNGNVDLIDGTVNTLTEQGYDLVHKPYYKTLVYNLDLDIDQKMYENILNYGFSVNHHSIASNMNPFTMLSFWLIENYNIYSYFNINKTILDLYSDDANESLFSSLILALKTFIMLFAFIWVRASFPRTRFDQLMTYCWTILLPLVFGSLILVPCLLYVFDMMASNTLYF